MSRSPMLATAALLAACVTAPATAPVSAPTASPAAFVRPSEPPPPGPARPLPVPEVHRGALDNGLSWAIVEDHEVPIAWIHVVVEAGEVDDPWLAHLTAQQLLEGSESLDREVLLERVETAGGTIEAFTRAHQTVLSIEGPSEGTSDALAMLAELVQRPRLPDETMPRQRQRLLLRERRAQAVPEILGRRLLSRVIYGDGHPYAEPTVSPAHVERLGGAEVRAFWATHYRPARTHVVVAGDVDPARVAAWIEHGFGAWPTGEVMPAVELPPAPAPTPAIHVVDRPGPNVGVWWAGPIPARRSPSWVPLRVLVRMLGEGMSSTLFEDLRERRGLTYNINACLSAGNAEASLAAAGFASRCPELPPGTLALYTQTPQLAPMLAGLLEHVERARREPPSPQALRTAVQSLHGNVALDFETASQVASALVSGLLYGLPWDERERYRSALDRLTPADVLDAAREHLRDPPVLVLVGDAERIRSELRELSPLRALDVFVYGADLTLVATHPGEP